MKKLWRKKEATCEISDKCKHKTNEEWLTVAEKLYQSSEFRSLFAEMLQTFVALGEVY